MFRFYLPAATATALFLALLGVLMPTPRHAQAVGTAIPALAAAAPIASPITATAAAIVKHAVADAVSAAEPVTGTPGAATTPLVTATARATRTAGTPTPAATQTVTKAVDAAESAVVTATTAALAAGAEIGRQALTIHFDDFDAAAELTYPSAGDGPFPTLLLIAGSGTEDMDASICGFGGAEPLSQNFRLIAEELPKHGFAVLRYNKHYVTGPCQADFMQYYTRVDLPLLLEDAGQVLAAAQANDLVDARQLYLYGWSEGSTIATALAISNSDVIAGLVLQAPVALPWYDTFLYQFAKVQLPYVRELADDGEITPDALLALVSGDAGLVAMGGLTYLADPQVMAQNQLALNPFFDQDADGAIDIDAELLPNVRAYLDGLFVPGGPFAIYTAEHALPVVSEQAAALRHPLLILQGENDANVPVFGAQWLDTLLVANPDHTLLLYPGLGHSLGQAASAVADNFAPMQPQPIADLVDWLTTRAAE